VTARVRALSVTIVSCQTGGQNLLFRDRPARILDQKLQQPESFGLQRANFTLHAKFKILNI
jgi:hypothetical protein